MENDLENRKLLEEDKLKIALAKANRQIAVVQAEKALLANEKAELQYQYLILQLYMKYNLTKEDAIGENGDIIKGGASIVNEGE